MDLIDKRVRLLGFPDLWSWLEAHPDPDWIELGKELGFVPIAVVRKAIKEAPSPQASIAQCLLRQFRRQFPDGWHPNREENVWPRAVAVGGAGAKLHLSDEACFTLLDLDTTPAGWNPADLSDPLLQEMCERAYAVHTGEQP